MNELTITERAKQCYEYKEIERLGLSPDEIQRDLILRYLTLLFRENKNAELLPSGEEEHLFLRHFCDSLQLLLLFGFKKNGVVLNIGAGGGFPAVPLRIFRPDLSFVLIEPARKKAEFLSGVKAELGFDNVEVYASKAEGVSLERKADYVVNRNGGTLQKFAQAAKPFLDKDGRMYTYKTKPFAAELTAITENKGKDGVQIREIAQYDLGHLAHGLNLVSMEFV